RKLVFTNILAREKLGNFSKMIKGSFSARIKCALVLIIFMLIPIIPVTGLVGLYVFDISTYVVQKISR
ncbi:MAG: hypothetical protein J0649_06840, partial [Methylococcales bacterium]|nr:hypothetical protein [Methylococcales bacterium]